MAVWIRQVAVRCVNGFNGLVGGLAGLIHVFFSLLFDLPRWVFQLPWLRLIYHDLLADAVVVPGSVNLKHPPRLCFV